MAHSLDSVYFACATNKKPSPPYASIAQGDKGTFSRKNNSKSQRKSESPIDLTQSKILT
jgi:hypothetical protein